MGPKYLNRMADKPMFQSIVSVSTPACGDKMRKTRVILPAMNGVQKTPLLAFAVIPDSEVVEPSTL